MKRNKIPFWLWMVVGLLLFLGILQCFQPHIPQAAVTGEIQAPPPVKRILKNACFNCHTNQTELSWFDHISPASFLVADHIEKGRKALNFSEWDQLTPPQQKAKLYDALNKILQQEMPLQSYTLLHKEARLSANDIHTLQQYVSTLSPRQPYDSVQAAQSAQEREHFYAQQRTPEVAPAPNGIAYIPDYRSWKAMSTTDRVDNGTMRVIFGNAIAVKAIQDKHINPWPDGAVFAKVAWKEETDTLGNIKTGAFWQVEFMIKNEKKYAATKGWGWARWRGANLKPYGNDASFTQECIKCHLPQKANDYVFTLPLPLIHQ
ncbi:heme-binding domain-containing protein [Zhouia sp. PK063]|uniref:heme-binding domain-containing protein n=1 Tax=Zhouia sp. PK063 TaxID=3373602 RepID=UPI0037B33E72